MSSTLRQAAAERLRLMLQANQGLAQNIQSAAFPRPEFDGLQQWQRQRLRETYRDFLSHAGYQPAASFFLEQLYGGEGFVQRDQDVAKVYPVMSRLLTPHMLETVAKALELQAISIQLDQGMSQLMRQQRISAAALNHPAYADLYRQLGRYSQRKHQIELINELGLRLNDIVRQRLVLSLIRMLRKPARAAGFGALQDFLEQGLAAFTALGDAEPFVDAISYRELLAFERLLQGEDYPFQGLEEKMP